MHELNKQLETAFGHHVAGRVAQAEALYKMVLEAEPSHVQALSMLGMMLMDSQRIKEAEALFDRLLAIDPENPHALHNLGRLMQVRGNDQKAVVLLRRAGKIKPDLAPIHNDLAVSLHRLGQFDEALLALDRALAIDPGFAMAHDNRGVVLYDCQRFFEACDAHLKALENTDDIQKRISMLLNLAFAAYEAGDLAASGQACNAILGEDKNHADALEQLARVLYRQRRNEEALATLNRLARIQGLERKAGPEKPEATILVLGGAGASHVSTRSLFDPELFARMTLIMLSPNQADAPLGDVSWEALADADLIFNALGEVESNGGQFEAVKMLAARLAKPLLNSPDLVARTGRDQVTGLFAGIPGLKVPQVRPITRGDSSCRAFPLLIRLAGTHGGKDLSLIRTEPEFFEYMDKTPGDRFLLTEFFDSKDVNGHYKKYRFIFVDRKPYPYHLAIAEDWMVHYWRTDMKSVEWKQREEESFLTDWTAVFGPLGVAAVAQVAERMNLDYGGMDCSILPDGQVLFFEANACMLVHLDDSEPACKRQAVSRIRDAVTGMVRAAVKRDRSSKS